MLSRSEDPLTIIGKANIKRLYAQIRDLEARLNKLEKFTYVLFLNNRPSINDPKVIEYISQLKAKYDAGKT